MFWLVGSQCHYWEEKNYEKLSFGTRIFIQKLSNDRYFQLHIILTMHREEVGSLTSCHFFGVWCVVRRMCSVSRKGNLKVSGRLW